MVHSDGIWNDLELQRSFWNKDAVVCIMTHSETIFETATRKKQLIFYMARNRMNINNRYVVFRWLRKIIWRFIALHMLVVPVENTWTKALTLGHQVRSYSDIYHEAKIVTKTVERLDLQTWLWQVDDLSWYKGRRVKGQAQSDLWHKGCVRLKSGERLDLQSLN